MKKQRRSFQPTWDTKIVSRIMCIQEAASPHLPCINESNSTMFCKHLKLGIENFYKTDNKFLLYQSILVKIIKTHFNFVVCNQNCIPHLSTFILSYMFFMLHFFPQLSEITTLDVGVCKELPFSYKQQRNNIFPVLVFVLLLFFKSVLKSDQSGFLQE